MCGIIGYCGPLDAQTVLLNGLAQLEYRGYDSAGKLTGAFKKVMHLTPSEYRRERGRRYEG